MDRAARYSRQMNLPEIGRAGQDRLLAAKILVIGAGGLGCPALPYLAGAGIGTLGIVDHDRVEVSNLHRQILFTTQNRGAPKAATARDRLAALNPDIDIQAYDTELTDRNVLELFADYDAIVDGTDNFAARFLINDAAVKLGKPVIYAAIQGFEGQVSVFDAGRGPCYRCLYPKAPETPVTNCAQGGVIGALAGIVGTVQAMETIKLIVADASFAPLIGRLWMIDARTMESRIVAIPKRAACPVCAAHPSDIVLHYNAPNCLKGPVMDIHCTDTLPEGAVFIDVREQDEWNAGHIKGATLLPLSRLQKDPALFDRPATTCCIVYCQKGGRSRKAIDILTRAGFKGLYNLDGGFEAWCLAGKETVRS